MSQIDSYPLASALQGTEYSLGVQAGKTVKIPVQFSETSANAVRALSLTTSSTSELNKLTGVTTTTAQFNYLNTLTSNVQTQINTLNTNKLGNSGSQVFNVTIGGNFTFYDTPDGTTHTEVSHSGTRFHYPIFLNSIFSGNATAPANAAASGERGEVRVDANYIYICTATNTWKRVALSTW